MKFLIVTPTYNGKQYCDVDWSNSVKAQTGVAYRHIVADTSPAEVGTTYRNRLASLLPSAVVVRRSNLAGYAIDPLLLAVHTEARDYLLNTAADCDAYLSWESDIIAPVDALSKMAQAMTWGIDLCLFAYPDRENANNQMAGLGFTGISRALMQALAWDSRGGYGYADDLDTSVYHSVEGWLIRRALRGGYVVATLHNKVVMVHPNG